MALRYVCCARGRVFGQSHARVHPSFRATHVRRRPRLSLILYSCKVYFGFNVAFNVVVFMVAFESL
jgi:hypothetical protein